MSENKTNNKKSTDKKTTTAKKSTGTKKTTTAKKSTGTKKATTAKKSTGTKKATTAKKSTGTKKATTAKKATAAKKSTTAKKDNVDKKSNVDNKETVDKKSNVDNKATVDKKNNDSQNSSNVPKAAVVSKEVSTKKRNKKTRKKNKNKKKKSKKDKLVLVFKIFLGLFILGLVIALLILSIVFIKTDSVTDENFKLAAGNTEIYDRNGDLAWTFGTTDDYVTLDETSQYYIQGLIATEDAKFYKHSGVNLIGMVRATIQTIFTSSDSGGSTITMQLAKILYLQGTIKLDDDGKAIYDDNGNMQREYPYNNKIGYKLQQMVYAWKIESKYSKDEILENYINLLYFEGATGIEGAAKYYFGVASKDLSLSEAATLAGMTQLPGTYNPYKNLDAATNRRNIVLDRMVNQKYITKEEADKAKKTNIKDDLVEHKDNEFSDYDALRPFFDVLESELKDVFGDDFVLNTSNLKIYTTMDKDVQIETYKIINDYYGDIYYQDDVIQSGSTTLDTQNGEIISIGGGRTLDGNYPLQNYGAFYARQPGSTSKPIVDYGPALEYLGWSTYHKLVDKKMTYSDGKNSVNNSTNTYLGEMPISEALARSVNTIALQAFQAVANSVGIGKIEQFMKSLGITDSSDINEAYSIGGWKDGTTTLELAGAYAAFGNGGTYNEPHAIRSISIPKTSKYYEEYGEKYDYDYESHKAMSSSTAFMMTKMLSPSAYGNITSFMAAGLPNEAIKSGTTNWDTNSFGIKEGLPRDKWAAGYNPNITTVVWSGYDGKDEAKGYSFDNYGYWAGNIYQSIMRYINSLSDGYIHDDSLKQPSNVYSEKIEFTTDVKGKKTLRKDTFYFVKNSADANARVKEKLNEDNKDSDKDGLKDKEEIKLGTDPKNPDTDGDGLKDKNEVDAGTDPLKVDTDGDGLKDNEELVYGSDPLKADTDGDGLNDNEEKILGTMFNNVDTDGDKLSDKEEVRLGTNPKKADTDGDGLSDKKEQELKTNPLKADTDGDGINDKDDPRPLDPKKR